MIDIVSGADVGDSGATATRISYDAMINNWGLPVVRQTVCATEGTS